MTRTVTARELNRALLARQLLLERSPVAIPRALERMAFLQAQYAPAMYLGLWSRVDGLRRAELTALLEKRTVVQGTLLRATIHLVSARDYWPAVLGIREARRVWMVRAGKRPAEEFAAAAAKLRAALAGGGAKRQMEIDKLLGPGLRAGARMWLDLVRIPPSGTWEHRPPLARHSPAKVSSRRRYCTTGSRRVCSSARAGSGGSGTLSPSPIRSAESSIGHRGERHRG